MALLDQTTFWDLSRKLLDWAHASRMSLEEQKTFWETNGYLILPRFYKSKEIDAATNLLKRLWENPPANVVVDNTQTSKRGYWRDVSPEDRNSHIFKVNDLYLEYPEIRDLSINERIGAILKELLGEAPVQCNSLNFEKGSQQPNHIDSLFMTPLTPGHLCATWVALENCHDDAGPLVYYPGSHKIPLYRFSNGGHHYILEELLLWNQYIEAKVQELGLKPQRFGAKKGDVFIWSANLLHGGCPIRNLSLTRKSLVSHFFSYSDSHNLGFPRVAVGPGYWLQKTHQPVPAAA